MEKEPITMLIQRKKKNKKHPTLFLPIRPTQLPSTPTSRFRKKRDNEPSEEEKAKQLKERILRIKEEREQKKKGLVTEETPC